MLKQLQYKDHEDFEKTFLYKLAKTPGLKWFKHIYFFSSVQDGYIQYDSARMQVFANTDCGHLTGKYKRMMKMSELFKEIDIPVT